MNCYHCGKPECDCSIETTFACLNGHVVAAFDQATTQPLDLTNHPCPICLGAFIVRDSLPPACALAPIQ